MKAQNIPITEGRHIQFENWTETKTGEYVTTEETKMLHISYCGKVKEFHFGWLCMYPDAFGQEILNGSNGSNATKVPTSKETMGGIDTDYIYEVTIPKGTKISKYNNERRVMLNANFSISLIGIRKSWRIHVEGKGGKDFNKIILF